MGRKNYGIYTLGLDWAKDLKHDGSVHNVRTTIVSSFWARSGSNLGKPSHGYARRWQHIDHLNQATHFELLTLATIIIKLNIITFPHRSREIIFNIKK